MICDKYISKILGVSHVCLFFFITVSSSHELAMVSVSSQSVCMSLSLVPRSHPWYLVSVLSFCVCVSLFPVLMW